MRFPLLLINAICSLLLSSCHQSVGPAVEIATQGAVSKIDGSANENGNLLEETWDAYSMQGVRVGYAHTTVAKTQEDGQTLILTKSQIHLSLTRSGQTIVQQMTLGSWDTQDGRLVRFESRMTAGAGEVVSIGAVHGNQLGIDTTTLGRTHSQKIPWQPEWGGLFATDQSLRQKPLKPGEKRILRSLSPDCSRAADTYFEARDYETVNLPSGSAKLLKINCVLDLGPQKIDSTCWTNDQGEVLKTIVPGLQQEVVRTTKADALKTTDAKFDLLAASTVPLKRDLPNAHTTRRAVYKAHVTSGSISGLFSSGLSQQLKPIDDQTAQITVTALRPVGSDQRAELAPAHQSTSESPPLPADLSPSNFIQSDDAIITQMAAHVAPRETDPWKIACALEKFVADAVHNKNFSTAFATAAETARSLEGDCTEHAVLLAALCRAKKIPARTSFGLVYYPPQHGFAYHMWTEAWITDRWIPLDATFGLGGIGADHIKLGHSSLSTGTPMTDLLGVIQIFGRLELELISAE
jgi:hypothetical protein